MGNGRCNHCSLKLMEAQAKKEGKKVVRMPSTFSMGGEEIYIVGKDEVACKENWKVWFMAMTDHCAC